MTHFLDLSDLHDRHARLAAESLAATRAALDRVKAALDARVNVVLAATHLDEAADHAITARLHVAAVLPQHIAALEADSLDVEEAFFAARNRLATAAMHALNEASQRLNAAKRNTRARREAQQAFDVARARMDKAVAYVPFMSRD